METGNKNINKKMNKKELEFILQKGEGFKIEFKESFNKSVVEDIVAFANAQGGRVFLGIDDKNKTKGIKITNELKSQIETVARNCDSGIKIDLEIFKNILIINIPEGKDKPYKCSSGFYLRRGSNSQKMTREEIREFFNKEGKILFDEMINKNFSFKNGFDKNKFNIFLQKAKISKVISKKEILKNLGVLNNKGKFRNAGVLFFCDKIEKFIPQAIVSCVLYKGKNKIFIIDKKDFTSDIYSNYQNAIEFLYRNLRLKYEIKGFGPRKEVLEIPEEALKEAIINALAHRDYSEKGADILVEIYDDRVEITNPGGLVSAIKKSEFGKKSVSRNPLLFSLFKRVNLVEKVGSGISRMRGAMKKAGLPLPKFEFTNFFTITFKRPKTTLEKVGEKVGEKLSKNQKSILKYFSKDKNISIVRLSKKVRIAPKNIEENIKKLKQKGLIKRVGSARAGYWEIIKKNKK